MEKLTEKQEELLYCIKSYINSYGFSPSIRELQEMMNKKSTSTIKQGLDILRKKGYIDFKDCKFRTIKILNEAE